jgi:hypothetical protein
MPSRFDSSDSMNDPNTLRHRFDLHGCMAEKASPDNAVELAATCDVAHVRNIRTIA